MDIVSSRGVDVAHSKGLIGRRPVDPGDEVVLPNRLQEIQGAALKLFALNGYAATTMADISADIGIKAPSIYNHVDSKHQLLFDLMQRTMDRLLAGFEAAGNDSDAPAPHLRRAVEAHVRYHSRHRYEAFVGNREIRSLQPESRRVILAKRAKYEQRFRDLIQQGANQGVFHVTSVRLTSYALLDMGIGVATWYRPSAEDSEDSLVYLYGELALRLVGFDPLARDHDQ